MTDDEVAELRDAVSSLRERLEELERRLDSGGGENNENDAYDHYDRAALDALDGDVASAPPRAVVKAYEQAGVFNETKQKRRAKRLKRLEGENEK